MNGKQDNPSVLTTCLNALQPGDILVVWKLDRLGCNLKHIADITRTLQIRNIGLKILEGQGADIDIATANGRLIFGILAAIAEYKHALISERTKAGLNNAREHGRKGGRKPKMTSEKLYLAQKAMENPETKIGDLCKELGIASPTLYKYVDPTGQFKPPAHKLIGIKPACSMVK